MSLKRSTQAVPRAVQHHRQMVGGHTGLLAHIVGLALVAISQHESPALLGRQGGDATFELLHKLLPHQLVLRVSSSCPAVNAPLGCGVRPTADQRIGVVVT